MWLQWGRRLSTTETADAAPLAVGIISSFNGAVVFQRRKPVVPPIFNAIACGFNGAVVFQRRKQAIVESGAWRAPALQWGRRLSTTETSRPMSFGCLYSRFNGAVVFQRRKRESRDQARARRVDASMGPSSFNDGNLADSIAIQRSLTSASMGPSSFNDGNLPSQHSSTLQSSRFNGAVVFQRRKRRYAANNQHRHHGFNGAVVFQRRKHERFKSTREGDVPLQWGRRLSTTETTNSLSL